MLEHPLWLSEPFTKGQAFWDLVARANHTDADVIFGNKIIHVKRGQLFTSEVKLAERWQWSRNRVRRYLDLLNSMQMGTAVGTGFGTLITIENYSIFQDGKPDNGTANETESGAAFGTAFGTSSGTQTRRTKEEQEYINNNIYSRVVEHLNARCGTSYRANTKKTKELINARLNEGFTLEDFKTVIDKKADEWMGTEFEQYLKPDTLFTNKFEGYLNQRITRKETGNAGKQADSRAEERAGSAAGAGDEYEKFFK